MFSEEEETRDETRERKRQVTIGKGNVMLRVCQSGKKLSEIKVGLIGDKSLEIEIWNLNWRGDKNEIFHKARGRLQMGRRWEFVTLDFGGRGETIFKSKKNEVRR